MASGSGPGLPKSGSVGLRQPKMYDKSNGAFLKIVKFSLKYPHVHKTWRFTSKKMIFFAEKIKLRFSEERKIIIKFKFYMWMSTEPSPPQEKSLL